MAVRRKQSEASSKGGAKPLRAGPALPPEAFADHEDISPKAVRSIQHRANKILKKGKWVVVDGYAGQK